jgi:hypothetical protein
MMRRHYIRSYGAFGAQSRYRIKPPATPKACADSPWGGMAARVRTDSVGPPLGDGAATAVNEFHKNPCKTSSSKQGARNHGRRIHPPR